MPKIEGFKLHIKNSDLTKLLKSRALHHLKRAIDKEKEVPALKALLERTKARPEDRAKAPFVKMSNSYHMQDADPVGALEKDIRTHRDKAARFGFFAKHLAPKSIYELSEAEAQRLELINDDEE